MNNHYTGECGKLKRLPIEERVDFVRSSRLCFRCLCEGHYSRDCQTTCETCGRRHHVMLHDDTRGTADHKEAQPDSTPQENQDPVEVNTYTTTSKQTSTAKVSMPVVPVIVKGSNCEVETYALIDTGSDVSLIRRDIFDSLSLRGSPISYSMKTMTTLQRVGEQYKTKLKLSSLDGEMQVQADAVTVGEIPIDLTSMLGEEDIARWKHLRNVNLPRIESTQVGLIIGSNVSEAAWTLDEKRGQPGEPTARLTVFGWTVVGPYSTKNDTTFQVNWTSIDTLQDHLRRQWEFDFQDLPQENKEAMSQEDQRAY